MRYLNAFKHVAETGKSNYELIGDCLLVEMLSEEEFKTKGGIILSAALTKNQVNGLASEKPTFVRVLLVGEGYYDDDTMKDIPLDTKPGDIALVGAGSLKRFSIFGRIVNSGESNLALVREGEIQMRFRGQEGFDEFFKIVNRSLEASGQKEISG